MPACKSFFCRPTRGFSPVARARAVDVLALALLLGACGTGRVSGQPEETAPLTAESSVTSGAETWTASLGAQDIDPITHGYPLVQLQEDFRELQKYIESYHPRLYADRAALSALLETHYALLRDGMTELEFLRLLAPIVSELNCGHSSIFLSHAYQDRLAVDGRYFPLLLRFFDGKARVTGNGLYPEIPLGAELLSINGVSMDATVARLFGNLSADG
ncbi:MAG: hypothetical protein ABIJ86_15645, partial [Spirochaetota bacterium]